MPILSNLALLMMATTPPPTTPLANAAASVKAMTACVAVTRVEIEEALGLSVGNGKERKDRGTSSCEYDAADGQVTVALYHSTVKLNLTSEVKHLQKSIPQATIREVSGLGTRAFFMDMEAIGTQLHVIRGEYDYVLVSVLGFGGASQVSGAAEKIARRALDRF